MNATKKNDIRSVAASKRLKGSAKRIDSDTLQDRLKIRNTIPIKWIATVIDAGDGNGDGIIELPDDLMTLLDWKIGDKLDFEIVNEHKAIVRKIDQDL